MRREGGSYLFNVLMRLFVLAGLMACGVAHAAGPVAAAGQSAVLPRCQVAVPAVCGNAVEPRTQASTGDDRKAEASPTVLIREATAASPDACRLAAEHLHADTCPTEVAALRYRYADGTRVVDGRVGVGAAARSNETFRVPLRYTAGLPIERDQMGFSPAYLPGPVSHAPSGDLVVRWAHLLQRRSQGGMWQVMDLAQAAKTAIELLPDVAEFRWEWNQGMSYADQRVAFDSKGVMYTLAQGVNWRAKAQGKWSVGLFMLSSSDGGSRWSAQQVPLPDNVARWRARIEVGNGHNDTDGPPTLLIYDADYREQRNPSLYVYLRLKGEESGLAQNRLIRIADDSLLQDNHSGAANSTATAGGYVYVTYPRNRPEPDKPGTPAVLVVLDRTRGEKVAEEVVGQGGVAAGVDNHNVPGICMGRNATLQVLLPGHHEDLLFRRGTASGPVIHWQPVERLGVPAVKGGGYTYGSLDCSRDGRTLVTTRWAGNQYRFQLVLLQADAAGVWRSWDGRRHLILVDPGRSFYGAWRQKASLDRNGRIHLYYSSYLNQLTDREYADFRLAFPFEAWDRVALQTPAFCVKGAEPRCWRHPMPDVGAVVIYSDDLLNWRFLE